MAKSEKANNPAERLELEGTLAAHPPGAELLRAADREVTVRVSIVLPHRPNADRELTAAAHGTREMTPEQLEALCAPDEGQVATVSEFARKEGLRVVGVSKLRREIVLEGTSGAVDRL